MFRTEKYKFLLLLNKFTTSRVYVLAVMQRQRSSLI